MIANTLLRYLLSTEYLDTKVVVRCNQVTYEVDKVVTRKDGTIIIRTKKGM